MGDLCMEGIVRDHVMALPSALNYRVWSSGPRGAPSLANRRGHASKTRKNLFGPVDHDENLRFVREELDKIAREDSERWNFDFKTEKPIEGRFEWVAVGEAATEASQSTRLPCLTANNVNKKQVKRLTTSPPTKMRQRLCTDYFRVHKAAKPKSKTERKSEKEVGSTLERRNSVPIR